MISLQPESPLEKLSKEVDHWRKFKRKKYHRLPETYWKKATKLAKTIGVEQTAEALGLETERLARRLNKKKAKPSVTGLLPVAQFEIKTEESQSSPLFVLESSSGAKLSFYQRLELQDLTALATMVIGGEK